MLTRSGLGAVLVAIVLITLGPLVELRGTRHLGDRRRVLLVMMAIVVAQRPLRASVERRASRPSASPGSDPVRVLYRIRNDTTHRSGRATLIDRCDGTDVEFEIEAVGANAVTDLPSVLFRRRRRRGVFDLGPLDIAKIDPFYLAAGRWRQREERSSQVTVSSEGVRDEVGPQGSSRVVENEVDRPPHGSRPDVWFRLHA